MIKVFNLNKRSNFLKHFIYNYCCCKDEMKKIVCEGGKATVLWGISDNLPQV